MMASSSLRKIIIREMQLLLAQLQGALVRKWERITPGLWPGLN
jgi:hypothetical protein